MAGIADDASRYVCRDKSHYVAHLRAEGMIAAQRQHRHRELALSCEGLVVFSVLIEGRELVERRVHGARTRIELGVVLSGRFIDGRGIGGEFVPKPVEIDALSAG